MLGRRIVVSIAICAVLFGVRPATAVACSPPFEQPTIKALGPQQIVVVGMTGERVLGGRLFHVSRWFNGLGPATPILIDFKEGEPVGDCSYPMGAGVPLVIAPDMVGGRLAANLITLQADPASDLGKAYLAEATALFGPGVVPPAAPVIVSPEPAVAPASTGPDATAVAAFLVLAVALVLVSVLVMARRGVRAPG